MIEAPGVLAGAGQDWARRARSSQAMKRSHNSVGVGGGVGVQLDEVVDRLGHRGVRPGLGTDAVTTHPGVGAGKCAAIENAPVSPLPRIGAVPCPSLVSGHGTVAVPPGSQPLSSWRFHRPYPAETGADTAMAHG
ncbi:hypothetical protein GCM10027605_71660 [Micromonospora zhanjiangensis]